MRSLLMFYQRTQSEKLWVDYHRHGWQVKGFYSPDQVDEDQ